LFRIVHREREKEKEREWPFDRFNVVFIHVMAIGWRM